jgi:hypothetical protein
MKSDSINSFILRMIPVGIIIIFISCSGCVQYTSPSEIATPPPIITSREIPAQTQGMTSTPTLFLSPLTTETSQEESTQSTGSLTIWSSPSACSVYIDGMYVGDTPAGRESFTKLLKNGPHTVKITKIGYEDYLQNVYVSAGKSLIVTATLSEKTFPYYTLNPTSTFTEST